MCSNRYDITLIYDVTQMCFNTYDVTQMCINMYDVTQMGINTYDVTPFFSLANMFSALEHQPQNIIGIENNKHVISQLMD